MRLSNFSAKRGFTLVELTVALAITALIIIVLVSMTNTGLSVWKQSRDQVRTSAAAQSALAILYKDFEQIQKREGNSYEWLYSGPSVQESGSGPRGLKLAPSNQLIFLTSATDRNDGRPSEVAGDITAVSYRIAYRDHILNEGEKTNTGFPVFTLYRRLLSPSETYQSILGKDALDKVWGSFAASDLDPKHVLVENVLELSYVFEVEYEGEKKAGAGKESKKIVEPVVVVSAGQSSQNACSEFRVKGDGLEVKGPKASQLKNGRIVSMIISMSVVTDEGMQYIEDVRKNRRRHSMSEEDFCKRYTRQFSQRFALP